MTPAQNDGPLFRAVYAQFYKPACCTQRDTGRRVEILHDSALVFAMAANA